MLGALLARRKARTGSSYLNSREIDKFLKDWRDDAVFIYPGSTSVSGEHKGKRSIRLWWMTFYEQFPESHFTTKGIYIRNIMTFLPSNQIAIGWEVDVKNITGNRFHNHGVSIVNIQNGKITRFEDYIFDLETLEKAWSSNKAMQPTSSAAD
jgi:ketosteroid isomerase-like protein